MRGLQLQIGKIFSLFSFLPVMNEKHAAARWILYIPNFFIVTESIFLKNNEASLVLSAAAFLKNCTQFEPVLRPVFLLPLVP